MVLEPSGGKLCLSMAGVLVWYLKHAANFPVDENFRYCSKVSNFEMLTVMMLTILSWILKERIF